MTAYPASRRIGRIAILGALVLALPACNTFERLSEMGSGPNLSKIEDPQAKPGYQPVSMPMPTPVLAQRNPNSLWRTGSRAFLRDQRAAQVGDLLTVFIKINDNASLDAGSTRTRGTGTANNETMNLGLGALPGVNGMGALSKLAGSALNFPTVNVNGASSTNNTGTVRHQDNVLMQLAAVVVQTLPNGNLVIQGKQQVKVNQEMRELAISGIVRPEDIDSSNQISYEKIAEARISYGGQGFVSDVQSPRYGQELLDILLPF